MIREKALAAAKWCLFWSSQHELMGKTEVWNHNLLKLPTCLSPSATSCKAICFSSIQCTSYLLNLFTRVEGEGVLGEADLQVSMSELSLTWCIKLNLAFIITGNGVEHNTIVPGRHHDHADRGKQNPEKKWEEDFSYSNVLHNISTHTVIQKFGVRTFCFYKELDFLTVLYSSFFISYFYSARVHLNDQKWQ